MRTVSRPSFPNNRIPDFAYVREQVPIIEIARLLGISVPSPDARWIMATCYRPERHENGDRTPSLGFCVSRNRYMCFKCDDRLKSNLDLVMAIRECEVQQAAAWITRYFKVPTIEKGTRANPYWDFRAGVDQVESVEDLVKAGLLTQLKDSERSVLFALCAHRDGNGSASMSYSHLMHTTGIGSRATIARAIQRFREIGLLTITHGWQHGTGRRATNTFTFTPGNVPLSRQSPQQTAEAVLYPGNNSTARSELWVPGSVHLGVNSGSKRDSRVRKPARSERTGLRALATGNVQGVNVSATIGTA